MNSPDKVFRELGQLYDFYREIAKFRITDRDDGKKRPSTKAPASGAKTAPHGRRSMARER